MARDEEARTDAQSVDGSIDLDLEDRLYLEAQEDPERIANKFSRGPQRLGYASIICIVINRMIGTGIFKTPTTLINGTQSVGVALMFWFCGALATLAGAVVLVEFGLTTPRYMIDGGEVAVPRNGGELNYPKYLVTCVYGLFFVIIGNMAGNSIAFSYYLLVAAGHDEPSTAAVRGIALGVVTFACSLHGTWRKGGIWLNNIFAVLKVSILLFIIIVGFCALGGTFGKTAQQAGHNFAPDKSFANESNSSYGYAEGFLAVIFAYDGFNQANYVLSEIDQPRKKFRKGVISAVCVVCLLYLLVNIAYLMVVSKDDPRLSKRDVSEVFFDNAFGHSAAPQVLNAFMAISALGNIIVMTFTAARVKQEIAKEGVLPYPKFFGQNTNIFGRLWNQLLHRPLSAATVEATPVGALSLHWAFSVILIVVTWGQKNEDAYKILVLIYSYSLGALLYTILGFGLLYLRLSSQSPGQDGKGGRDWRSRSQFNHYLSIASAFVFGIANLYPLIGTCIPPTGLAPDVQAVAPDYPSWIVPTVGWALVGCGVLYWLGFVFVVPKIGYRKGKVFVVEREPFFHVEHGYHVQWHEIVSFNWVVNGADGRREMEYDLDD